MTIASDPTSLDVLRQEGWRRAGGQPTNGQDFEQHLYTYRNFIRWGTIFVAHVAVILALMAFFLLR